MSSRDVSTGRRAVVAVIDSGIDFQKSDLDNYRASATGFLVGEKGYIEERYMPPANEHGTAIALIIRHVCPNVVFQSINILNERLTCDGRVLIHAFRHAVEMNPDVINLSLGTTRLRYVPAMKGLLAKAKKQGTVIVAAASNSGAVSYPAYLKAAMGVKCGLYFNPRNYGFNGDFFIAPGGLDGIQGAEETIYRSGRGNSMAAGYITGHVSRIVSKEGRLELDELQDRLLAGCGYHELQRLVPRGAVPGMVQGALESKDNALKKYIRGCLGFK